MLPIPIWSQEPAVPDARFAPPGLAQGDQLSVHMYDFPELAPGIQLHVGADGSVHLPYAGTIPALGMSPDQLQLAISESLKAKGIVKDPNVTVDIISAINLSVNVVGQVVAPRVIPIFAPTPLSYVIAQAGGLTPFASRKHIRIVAANGSAQPVPFDYKKVLRGESQNQKISLAPGDTVVVP